MLRPASPTIFSFTFSLSSDMITRTLHLLRILRNDRTIRKRCCALDQKLRRASPKSQDERFKWCCCVCKPIFCYRKWMISKFICIWRDANEWSQMTVLSQDCAEAGINNLTICLKPASQSQYQIIFSAKIYWLQSGGIATLWFPCFMPALRQEHNKV